MTWRRFIPGGISALCPAILAIGLLLLVLGLRDCTADPAPRAPVFVDTASAAEYRRSALDARRQLEEVPRERDGLRGRFAALQARLAGLYMSSDRHRHCL